MKNTAKDTVGNAGVQKNIRMLVSCLKSPVSSWRGQEPCKHRRSQKASQVGGEMDVGCQETELLQPVALSAQTPHAKK